MAAPKKRRKVRRARAASAARSAPARRPVLGYVDVGLGILLTAATWGALPARWWPVDTVATLLAGGLLVAGVGLVRGAPWARTCGLAAGGVALVVGAGLVTTLAFTASHLAGLYGPVGQGGALILVTVAALILPYLVVLPALQVFVLSRPEAPRRSGDDPKEPERAEADDPAVEPE